MKLPLVTLMTLMTLLTLLTLLTLTSAEARRLLLLPGQLNSHMMYFGGVASEMVARGHQVYVALASSFPTPDFLLAAGVRTVNFRSPDAQSLTLQRDFSRRLVSESLRSELDGWTFVNGWSANALRDCQLMMDDLTFLDQLSKLNLDHVLVDAWPLMRCGYVLPKYLNVSYSSLVTVFEPWISRVPALPSFAPNQVMPYSDRMNFFERLKNFLFTLHCFRNQLFTHKNNVSLLEKFFPGDAHNTWDALAMKSMLFLVNTGPPLAHPTPTLPNLIQVGGLTTQPAKPLQSPFLEAIEQADRDVIVVSFGSVATYLPPQINAKLFHALRKLDYTIFWRYNGPELEDKPDHVHVHAWLPQNDLVGHRRTRLLVTHCGNNGQWEAVLHGVPLLCMPIFADQRHNSERITQKKFGDWLDLSTFSTDQLHSTALRILGDQTFRENIQKASAEFLFRRENPRQRAADWLEYVMKFGDENIRSRAQDMPFYQFAMIDIFAFFAAFFAALVALAVVALAYCCTKVTAVLCAKNKQARPKAE